MSILTWRQASRDRMADHAEVELITWAWREACDGAGLGRTIHPAGVLRAGVSGWPGRADRGR